MSEEDTIEQEPISAACAATLDEAAAYALGETSLSAPARLHLLRCPTCHYKLVQYQRVGKALPLAEPQVEPPAELRTRLLEAVMQQQAAKAPATVAPQAEKTRPKNKVPQTKAMPAWGLIVSLATAISLLLMLITWNVLLQSQISRQTEQLTSGREAWDTLIVLMNDPTVQVAKLSGSAAHGTLWSAPARDTGCIMLENLPALPTDQRYFVWLNAQGQWLAAGSFGERDSKSWFIVKPGQSFDHFTQLQVTIEPAAGSTQPSGPVVVQGTVGQS